jgi:hypothetical protein
MKLQSKQLKQCYLVEVLSVLKREKSGEDKLVIQGYFLLLQDNFNFIQLQTNSQLAYQ